MYKGRNQKRMQRDLRKATKQGKRVTTDDMMAAYGNKRKQHVHDTIVVPLAKHKKG